MSGGIVGVIKRVLVGCEESGKVRNAFLKKGHEAFSCDLVPTRDGHENHLQKDIMLAITQDGPWDIIILHPDCTALAVSGNRWYGKEKFLHPFREAAIYWSAILWRLAKQYARVGCALENPVSVIWQVVGAPHYIQPHDFGHGETKKTGIVVHNLPPLEPTCPVFGRTNRIWRMPPSPTRKRDRSETYQGIADAMAEQWG